jgi:predicted alpha/beta-fold hydrolase
MPIIEESSYAPPLAFVSEKINSFFAHVKRRVSGVKYVRERITTEDNDVLDLDWSTVGSDRLAILSHGLEGDTKRPYMLGMVQALNQSGWDVLAWNFRSCGDQALPESGLYHAGSSHDLQAVVDHVTKLNKYSAGALIGFSLGGSIILKYLGEVGESIRSFIKAAVCFSSTCNLQSSVKMLSQPENQKVLSRLIGSLKEKIYSKRYHFPQFATPEVIERIRNFFDFDHYITAPFHGFKSAEDYWTSCSAKRFVKNIKIPTLLVNAKDDPLLGDDCYPVAEARESKYLFLEMPKHGGHIGFSLPIGPFWSEKRAVEFLQTVCP